MRLHNINDVETIIAHRIGFFIVILLCLLVITFGFFITDLIATLKKSCGEGDNQKHYCTVL